MATTSRRRFVVSAVASLATCAHSSVARADEDMTAKVSVDRDKVKVGEEFVLVLEIERTGGGRVPTPELPVELEDSFDVLQCMPRMSTNISMFNGRGTRVQNRSLRCVLAPRKVGEFSVTIAAKDDGKTVRSNTVKIAVEGTEAPAPADASQTDPIEPDGDIFLWASVDRARAYVGEQVTYSLDVYEARRFLDPHLRTPPTFQDFFSEELEVGQPRLTTVGGSRYRVRPALRRALFPQKAGRLTIGAAEITIGLRSRKRSSAIEVEVLPLPAEGQPPVFSPNNVGSFDIEAGVDRTELEAGEPFTLTVTISGRGNIDVVDPGAWPSIVDVRRYDPKAETRRDVSDVIGGSRVYSFLMIPEKPGTLEIPAHEFSFFDPGLDAYQTVRTEPISVTVTGQAIESESEGAVETAEEAELLPVIAADAVPRITPRERWLDDSRWVAGMAAVPVIAGVGVGAGIVWRRFGPDDTARSRAEAKARRRAQIEAAESAVESGDGFHAAVAKLLQEAAVDRAGPDGVGLPRGRLIGLLRDRGVQRSDLDTLEGLLDGCDAARFANQRGTVDERRSILEDALTLVRRSSVAGEGR